MELNIDSLPIEDIVFMLLETLKSNGTFDEFRRHCVSDIYAKPTYQNWKQRIESNVLHFLNKLNFTPELNKNAIRERLRKLINDGHETQDIEEGADRILNQLLAPRAISIFEPKITVAVNEYLGIKNEAPPVELNGLKESSMNLMKVHNVEVNTVFNPKIDFIPDANNIACDKIQKSDRKDLRSDKKEKSSSLCKEFKSLNGSRSDDENDAGGSTKAKSSQHKNKTSTSDKSKSSSTNHKSSKKDNSCKEVVEKSKDIVEKSKDVINKPKDIINKSNDFVDKSKDVVYRPKDVIDKSKDVSKSKDIVDKSKDIVNKSKDVIDKSKDVSKSKDIVDKSKDIVNKSKDVNEKSKDVSKSKDLIDKSKDIVNKPKDIVDKSKDIVNKSKDIIDKSKDKSFLSKNSYSNSSSHKSNRTDTKKTKRSLEEKKKSSSLCKEPKLLNGNRSDDESNSGGSSKQKSTIHKNKSSSSDKTKSSSSNHKSSRRDNNSTDVVDKSKDKSLSKNSSSTDIVDKCKDKSLSKISNRTVDKSKEKSSSKNYTSTDINKSKKRSLSKNSSSTDIGKSKRKSSLSKNSSCIDIVDKSKNKSLLKSSNSTDETDKSKIKSSLLKNSRCTDVVDKSKDKSSLSRDSSSSSHKSNRTDTKRLKLSHDEKNKLPTNKVSIEEKKPEEPEKSEWNDFRSSITNDDQDAANVLLSMSAISYDSSHSEIITENIIFIENSSPITETLIPPKTENEIEVNENSDQTKILSSSDNDDFKENSQLKSNNLETPQSQNSIKSISNIDHFFDKVCSVEIERLSCNDIKPQCSSVNNVETTEEHQKPAEIVVDEKEFKVSNVKINVDPSENEKTNEYNSNDILKVPKLKLKLLPNQIDSLNKSKRKKHHKDKESKKLKLSKSFDIPSEVSVFVIDSVSTNIMCGKIDQKSNNDTDIKMNDSGNTVTNQLLHKEIENNSEKVLDDIKSFYPFKGFTDAEAIPCKNYEVLKNAFKTLQTKINNHNKIVDGFKGFTISEARMCEHRDIVYAALIKLENSKSNTAFLGFSKYYGTHLSVGHKYVIEQYELVKKQINVDNHHQNVKSGGNGIQKGKTFNEVFSAYLYKSNNDATSKEIYNKPIKDKKKDCPAVNNNNHNHDDWVVKQEMKYKLLPVKVKLERLMEFGCTNTKRVSDSSKFDRYDQQTEL